MLKYEAAQRQRHGLKAGVTLAAWWQAHLSPYFFVSHYEAADLLFTRGELPYDLCACYCILVLKGNRPGTTPYVTNTWLMENVFIATLLVVCARNRWCLRTTRTSFFNVKLRFEFMYLPTDYFSLFNWKSVKKS